MDKMVTGQETGCTPRHSGVGFTGRCSLLLILYLLSFHLQAQGTAVASIKPERVETGDTISLFVFVSGVRIAPKSVDFVSWTDIFPSSNILSRSDWRRSGTQWVQQFTLIAFDSATLELPPLTVLLPVGKPLNTNALTLHVYPTPGADVNDMEPIRDLYREPFAWTDYWPCGAGGLAVLLLVIWLIRRTTRRPQPVVTPAATPTPALSASDIALQKLRELQQRQLWKKDAVKEHYATLSMIVREYLEMQYRIAALESTTNEILSLLSSDNFPPDQRPQLKDFLQKTDMVKYAQSQPPEAAHETVLQMARDLVTPAFSKHREMPSNPPAQKAKTGKYEPL